jgi:serpin B
MTDEQTRKFFMRTLTLILACVLVGCALTSMRHPFAAKLPEPLQQSEFAFNLYRTVVKDKPNENMMLSPYSAQLALDLVRTGAAGETKMQIEKVLGYNDAVTWESFPANSPLAAATALWTQQGHPILPEFLNTARENFGASIEQADFAKNSAAAVKRINTWTSEKTKGKIPTLFDTLRNDTRVVLVSAIYFADDWETLFKEEWTSDSTFTLQDGTKTTTKIMQQSVQAHYGETDDTFIVELAYKNKGYSMLLLLPRDPAVFAQWESEITAKKWNELRGIMRMEQVYVRMPRFTHECKISLNETLRQLGISTAFTDAADFSRINGGNELLLLSEAIQKTYIKVDEKGTKAAAATGVSIGCGSSGVHRTFDADRPFLYAIVKEDSILFLGRYVKP